MASAMQGCSRAKAAAGPSRDTASREPLYSRLGRRERTLLVGGVRFAPKAKQIVTVEVKDRCRRISPPLTPILSHPKFANAEGAAGGEQGEEKKKGGRVRVSPSHLRCEKEVTRIDRRSLRATRVAYRASEDRVYWPLTFPVDVAVEVLSVTARRRSRRVDKLRRQDMQAY